MCVNKNLGLSLAEFANVPDEQQERRDQGSNERERHREQKLVVEVEPEGALWGTGSRSGVR